MKLSRGPLTQKRRKLEKFRRKFGYTGKIKEVTATKFFLSGGACAAGIIPAEEGQELMARLASLRKKIGVPPGESANCGPLNPHNPEKYHPNRLLEVFDRLRLMDGCILDCYCHRFSGFKLPCVYTREIGSAPVKSRKDFNDRFPHRRDRLRHIEIEPSPSGYFQFAVLNQTADQFHLFRNCPFGFTRPVATDNQLRRILDSIAGNVSIDELEKAREVRARLSAVESEGIVTVRFLTFNPMRGLYFQHTYIRSNMIEHVSKIKIVDCERRLAF
jgi:hypothetical protein